MKATKLITVAMFAAMLFVIAGRASAGTGAGHGGGHASSAHSASHATHSSGMGHGAGLSQRNRRFSSTYAYPPYYYGNGYYGNGYWGNGYYGNADEADWSEQWTSLSEDNDGPYARSTRENPQGQARMWEFPDK
jgi:hypothetical protein